MVAIKKTIIKSEKDNQCIMFDDTIVNVNKGDIVNITHNSSASQAPIFVKGCVTKVEHTIIKDYNNPVYKHICTIYVY